MFNLATARLQLWEYGSNVDYAEAIPEDIARFDNRLIQVIERFFMLGTWRSCWKRPLLTVYDGTITLPRGFDAAETIEYCCGGSVPIYSRFHQFAGYGSRTVWFPCGCAALRLHSDSVQSFRTPTGTFTLRIVAETPFILTDSMALSGGKDENEEEIFGVTSLSLVDGVNDFAQQYTELPYIQKIVTDNEIKVYTVDTTTSDATLIAVYAPGETVPSYRQYEVSGFANGDTVRALCKLGFIFPVSSTDLVLPANMGALKTGLMALRYEDKNDPERAGKFWGPNYPENRPGEMYGAIDLLDSELGELHDAEIPAMNIPHTFGAGAIPQVY